MDTILPDATTPDETGELKLLVAGSWGLLHRLYDLAFEIRVEAAKQLHNQLVEQLGESATGESITYTHEISNASDNVKVRASMSYQNGTVNLGYLEAIVGDPEEEKLSMIVRLIHPHKSLPGYSIDEAKQVISERLGEQCQWSGDVLHGPDVNGRNVTFTWTFKPTTTDPVKEMVEQGVEKVLDASECFLWWRHAVLDATSVEDEQVVEDDEGQDG